MASTRAFLLGAMAAVAGVQPQSSEAKKPKTTSWMIMDMIKQGSGRFLRQVASHYQGNRLVRTVNCGRNQPCVCGSGVKFKKCCLGK